MFSPNLYRRAIPVLLFFFLSCPIHAELVIDIQLPEVIDGLDALVEETEERISSLVGTLKTEIEDLVRKPNLMREQNDIL